MKGVNKINTYQAQLGWDVVKKVPKSVALAIAVSGVTYGGDKIDEARERFLREWWTLYRAGIVPQKPPFPRPDDKFMM